MKALYKYNATASPLIASALLIWLFCCASQHMVEREREKEWEKREKEHRNAGEGEKLGKEIESELGAGN